MFLILLSTMYRDGHVPSEIMYSTQLFILTMALKLKTKCWNTNTCQNREQALSALVCLLGDRFLPGAHQSYYITEFEGIWLVPTVFVPDFLKGRPILHCLDRHSRSKKYDDEDLSEGDKEGIFIIQSRDGFHNIVNSGRNSQEQMPSCFCKDWTRWHIPCKHIFTVFRLKKAWGGDALPQMYRDILVNRQWCYQCTLWSVLHCFTEWHSSATCWPQIWHYWWHSDDWKIWADFSPVGNS